MFGNMMKKAGQAAGAVASRTNVDVGGVSVNLGGLASAAGRVAGATGMTGGRYDVPHGLSTRFTGELESEDVQDLSRPAPPAGLDASAVQYADAWYGIWLRVRDGHIAIAQAAEARNLDAATGLLTQWRAAIADAREQAHRLGGFNGAQTLVLYSNEVSDVLEGVADTLEDFAGNAFGGERDEDEALEAVMRIFQLHISMNRGLRRFYADPSGAEVQAALDADPAAQQMNAMMAQLRNVDESGPEFQPIAGVSLHDWVAASNAMHAGMNADQVCQTLRIERPQWDQANTGWTDRLGQYPMTVGMKYQDYAAAAHPAFASAPAAGGALGGSQKDRLATDWEFFIECSAAMQAVPEAGMDGEAYLEKHYRVTAAEVSAAAMTWSRDMNRMMSMPVETEYKKKEIAAKLQAEIGPGIADDIVF